MRTAISALINRITQVHYERQEEAVDRDNYVHLADGLVSVPRSTH
jgi:hypothetical protein